MALPEIYVIDTSSIIEVRRVVPTSEQAKVFTALGKLVESGQLVYPVEVFKELAQKSNPSNPADRPYQWAKKHQVQACRHGTNHRALKAMLANPQLARIVDPAKAGVDEADPYVLTLADQLRAKHAVVVLSQERVDRPDKLSMASACGLLRIVCLRVAPFMEQQRIWPPP